MSDPDLVDFVHRELAQQFYNLVKVSYDEGKRTVSIDFTKIPPVYRISIPTNHTILSEAEPKMINALDFIEKVLPGLHGYARNSGYDKEEMCTRCGKVFKIK